MSSQPAWNVLLVDDDEDDYVVIRAKLGSIKNRKISLEWTQNSQGAIEALQQNRFDAILVDYYLGQENGLELIQSLAKSGMTIPMILFSGSGSFEIDQKAQEAGADFYFDKKELSPQVLERTIRYAIGRKRND